MQPAFRERSRSASAHRPLTHRTLCDQDSSKPPKESEQEENRPQPSHTASAEQPAKQIAEQSANRVTEQNPTATVIQLRTNRSTDSEFAVSQMPDLLAELQQQSGPQFAHALPSGRGEYATSGQTEEAHKRTATTTTRRTCRRQPRVGRRSTKMDQRVRSDVQLSERNRLRDIQRKGDEVRRVPGGSDAENARSYTSEHQILQTEKKEKARQPFS